MPYMTMDEPEYWTVPQRLRPIQEQRDEIFRALGHESLGAFEALATARFVQFALGDPEDNGTPAANLIELPAFFSIATAHTQL